MYAVTEKKNHTDYALATVSKLLEFYNNYFEIKYPLSKLGEDKIMLFQYSNLFFLFISPIFELMFSLLLFLFLDMVAIPDFLAGAMENWGLITFRETSLLVGQQSSLLEKQVVASVIAHELAHQVTSLC